MKRLSQWRLVVAVIGEFGGVDEAAAVLNVNKSTIWRWINAEIVLEGVALVAVKAVLRHPEEYKTKEALK